MTLIPLEIDPLSEGYVILITGLLIVFGSLMILSLLFKYGVPIMLYVYKIISKGSGRKIKDIPVAADEKFTGEIAAAIATAIHLYLREQHDTENAILTIKQARKLYSPWSSKIYGTQNRL